MNYPQDDVEIIYVHHYKRDEKREFERVNAI